MNRRQWKKLGKKIVEMVAEVKLTPLPPRNYLGGSPAVPTEAGKRFWALSQKQATYPGCTDAEQRELMVLTEMFAAR